MNDIATDTTSKGTWHIIKLDTDKYRVYSPGLRAYGTFDSIESAKSYIESNHPSKRLPIYVQDKLGNVIERTTFSLKAIKL